MIIGIAGPVDLNMLDFDFGKVTLPETNVFPLTTHLVNALLRRGHQVVVYTNSGTIAMPFVIEHEQLTICVAPTKPKPGRRFFNYEIDELNKLMQQHPADVVHAFWTYEYALAAIKSGLPTIVGIHDVASKILLTQFDIFRFVRWLMNYKAIRQSKYLAANSAYTYHQLSKKTQTRTSVINNFFSPELEQAVQEPVEKRNYIISVTMGFTKRKGVPRALHAFALLRKQYPDLEYHLIGADMEPGGAAQQYARKHGLDEGIRYFGPLPYDQLLKRVAEARVFLHPSVEESFGMAPLEAMVIGTAVVGGQKSGFIPYLLDHGKTGVLCDIYSTESMADAVRTLLQDETLSQRMVQNAKRFAYDNFSEEVVIQQHLDYLQKVHEQHNCSRAAHASVKTEAA
jgi:L-malate glycosyltransferase